MSVNPRLAALLGRPLLRCQRSCLAARAWSDPGRHGAPPSRAARHVELALRAFRRPRPADRCRHLDDQTLRRAELELQARDLGRLLGPNYDVRPVARYAGPTAEQAARDARKGDRIVLLPLNAQVGGPTTISPPAPRPRGPGRPSRCPGRGPRLSRHAPVRGRRRRDPVRGAGGLARAEQQVRGRLLRPRPGRSPGPYPSQVAATVRAVVARTGLARPVHLPTPGPPPGGAEPGPLSSRSSGRAVARVCRLGSGAGRVHQRPRRDPGRVGSGVAPRGTRGRGGALAPGADRGHAAYLLARTCHTGSPSRG